MDFDYIADNEDQMYKDLLEEETKEKEDKPKAPKSVNNYDDEGANDY